jgi:hypothetical protein
MATKRMNDIILGDGLTTTRLGIRHCITNDGLEEGTLTDVNLGNDLAAHTLATTTTGETENGTSIDAGLGIETLLLVTLGLLRGHF